MFPTQIFSVFLTLSILDATRGSNLRGKVRRKLTQTMRDSEDSSEQTEANICQGSLSEITFLYNGGDCSQCDNLQSCQEFSCIEPSGVPDAGFVDITATAFSRGGSDVPDVIYISAGSGSSLPDAGSVEQNYITATADGGSDVYFEGLVKVGEKYTLNEDRAFDNLSADIMTITIFESRKGGPLLQIIVMDLSCSQPLSLFDKFGASQITQWVETSGRVVTDAQTGVSEEQEETIDETSDQEQRCRAFENQECVGDFPVAAFCSPGEQGCCPDGITLHWNGEPDICTTYPTGIDWLTDNATNAPTSAPPTIAPTGIYPSTDAPSSKPVCNDIATTFPIHLNVNCLWVTKDTTSNTINQCQKTSGDGQVWNQCPVECDSVGVGNCADNPGECAENKENFQILKGNYDCNYVAKGNDNRTRGECRKTSGNGNVWDQCPETCGKVGLGSCVR